MMAEKILALCAAYALGLATAFWIFPKMIKYAVQSIPSIRARLKDAIEDIEKDER